MRRWLIGVLLFMACEPAGPHWHHVCTREIMIMEPQPTGIKGQPFIWVPRPHCMAWDSVWVIPAAHPEEGA